MRIFAISRGNEATYLWGNINICSFKLCVYTIKDNRYLPPPLFYWLAQTVAMETFFITTGIWSAK